MIPSRLAQLIAREEGFGRVGAVPTRKNNPGDLRHSAHSQHPDGPNDIGTIDTIMHGWQDLEDQLKHYASRGMNMRQMVSIYAPPSENNSTRYLMDLCHVMGVSPDDPVSEVLKIPGVSA